MIRIFFQNIIVVTFHLFSFESGECWESAVPAFEMIENIVAAENGEHSFENLANTISDMPKGSWYSAGLYARLQSEYPSEYIAGSYPFEKNGYRNNLKFYTSGVSPPETKFFK